MMLVVGAILETDIDFQESLLPKKKGYLQEVWTHPHTINRLYTHTHSSTALTVLHIACELNPW